MKMRFQKYLNLFNLNDFFPPSLLTIIMSLIVGIGAGFGAVLFKFLIYFFQNLSFSDVPKLLSFDKPIHLILMPAIGGLIIGPLIYFFAREAKGHGVPEVMEAVALHGGKIRPQVAVIKSLASSICIGTGGSVGREGPIAQIGSALGSTLGQLFKLPEDKIRNLVACGAAAGISATFNAPIAGAMFAMEVILGRLHVASFGAVVISAVSANVIAQIYEGNVSAFTIPQYSFSNPYEILLYSVLGIIAAVFAYAFTKFLYFSEDLWDRFNIPEYVKPIMGGLLLGLFGFFTYKIDGFPRIFGVGYETINQSLNGQLAINITIALLLFKLIATSLTLGSGGSGGIFAPSLFMGAMLGSSFGNVFKTIFPNLTSTPGAYALVGMAAFFSGAAHAPITAILILFEMTRDYRIILPLMFATVLSTFVSRLLSKESIYTLKLSRRGIHLDQGQDIDIMNGVLAGEIMIPNTATVSMDLPLSDLSDLFNQTHRHGYPIVNKDNELVGMVTVSDLDNELLNGEIKQKTVANIATKSNLIYISPTDTMAKAINTMSKFHLSHIPVVDTGNSTQLIGMIHISDIVNAYNRAISKKAQRQLKSEALRLGKLNNVDINNYTIPISSPLIGKRINEIGFPYHCLILSLRRGKTVYIPDGFTKLLAGDQLTTISEIKCSQEIENIISGENGIRSIQSDAKLKSKITIPNNSKLSGKKIKDLSLPDNIIIISIQRKNNLLIPHGDTILKPKDVLEVFGDSDAINRII